MTCLIHINLLPTQVCAPPHHTTHYDTFTIFISKQISFTERVFACKFVGQKVEPTVGNLNQNLTRQRQRPRLSSEIGMKMEENTPPDPKTPEKQGLVGKQDVWRPGD